VKPSESAKGELARNVADHEKMLVDEKADEAVNGSDDTNDTDCFRPMDHKIGRLTFNDSVRLNAEESRILPDGIGLAVLPSRLVCFN
jgi:hypothetical protein